MRHSPPRRPLARTAFRAVRAAASMGVVAALLASAGPSAQATAPMPSSAPPATAGVAAAPADRTGDPVVIGTELTPADATVTSTEVEGPSEPTTTAPASAPSSRYELAADSFDRTVTGGWGSASLGGEWTSGSSQGTYAVVGGAGTQRLTNGSTGTMHLAGVRSTDTDTRVDVSFDRRLDSDAALYASVLGRTVKGASDYRARLVVGRDGAFELRLARNATVLARTALADLVYAPHSATTIRLQVTGTSPTTLRAKAWPSGTAEPAGWQVTTTDAYSSMQTAGHLSLSTYVAFNSSAVVTSYSDLHVLPTVLPNEPPTAAFSAQTDDLTVVLDAGASTDGDGSVASVRWDHGDGTTATGTTSVHTYAAPGEHAVTLTVTDDRGGVGTSTRTVTVTAPNTPPTAAFSVVVDGRYLTVDASRSTDDDGTVTSHHWDFGDGATSTSSSATHTYATVGDYVVTLTVTDDRGGVSSTTQTVTTPPPYQLAICRIERGSHIAGHYQRSILHNRTGSSSTTEAQRAAANLAHLAGWETWRGAPGTVFGDFTASDSWATVDAYSGELNGWATLPARYFVNVGVPILTKDTSTNLRRGSQGAYTAHQPDGSTTGTVTPFRNLAKGFADRGMGGRVIYRLGWEFNAKTTFRWGLNGNNSGGNPSYGEGKPAQGVEEFKAYWRLIVADIRSVDPDAIIHWNPINGWDGTGETVESMYPGDEWVDMVGSDVYDNDYRGSRGIYANLQHGSTMSAADRAVLHQRMWDEFIRTGNKGYGLDWLADFAVEHDKMLGFGEWSNHPLHNTPFQSTTTRGWGGGDNPTMVQNFWDYLQTQRARGITVMDVHYDASVHDGDFSFYPQAPFSLAAAKYKELWSQVD